MPSHSSLYMGECGRCVNWICCLTRKTNSLTQASFARKKYQWGVCIFNPCSMQGLVHSVFAKMLPISNKAGDISYKTKRSVIAENYRETQLVCRQIVVIRTNQYLVFDQCTFLYYFVYQFTCDKHVNTRTHIYTYIWIYLMHIYL